MGSNVTLRLLQGQFSLRLDMIVRNRVPVTLIASHSVFVPVSAAGGVVNDVRGVASTDDNRL